MTIHREHTSDQAMKLRQRVSKLGRASPAPSIRLPRTIAISGGKGGVGKSNVSLNLACALAGRGHRVMLVDTDFGLSNLDVLLGVSPPFDLGDVVAGRCGPEDAVMNLASGISLLIGGEFAGEDSPTSERVRTLLAALSSQMAEADYVIIDTRAGLSDTVMAFLLAAETMIMVSTSEPTSILDTYRTVKRLCSLRADGTLGIVMNRCEPAEARRAYRSLARMIHRFLGRDALLLGSVPQDKRVVDAVRRQVPFLELFPHCRASRGILQLTGEICGDFVDRTPELMGFLGRLARHLLGANPAAGSDN